jgi:hypothetical protein
MYIITRKGKKKVLEYKSSVTDFLTIDDFPDIGESETIYIDTSTEKIYRWDVAGFYVQIGGPGGPGSVEIDDFPTEGSAHAVSSGGTFLRIQGLSADIYSESVVRGEQDNILRQLIEDTKVVVDRDYEIVGVRDGANKSYILTREYEPGSTVVVRNGLIQTMHENYDYIEDVPNKIIFDLPLDDGEIIMAYYRKKLV